MSEDKDKISLGCEIGPGVRLGARRRRTGELEVGSYTPAREGQAIAPGQEFLTLGDPDEDGWRDVEGSFVMPRGTAGGPPQVATDVYRENYDRIFGSKKRGLA